jgi:hypothetical protein
LEASAVEINDLMHKLDHSSCYIVLSPPCVVCGSLKGKLFYATKENTELKQEVIYLTACLEKTVLSEKIIEEDLSRVEESATKSTHKLGVGFERCEKKNEKSADPADLENAASFDEANFSSSLKQGKHLASSLNRILLYNIYIML